MSTVITEKTLKRIINEVLSRLMSDDASLPVNNGLGDVESPNDEFNDTNGLSIKDRDSLFTNYREKGGSLKKGHVSFDNQNIKNDFVKRTSNGETYIKVDFSGRERYLPVMSVLRFREYMDKILSAGNFSNSTFKEKREGNSLDIDKIFEYFQNGYLNRWIISYTAGDIKNGNLRDNGIGDLAFNLGNTLEYFFGKMPDNKPGADFIGGDLKTYSFDSTTIELFSQTPEEKDITFKGGKENDGIATPVKLRSYLQEPLQSQGEQSRTLNAKSKKNADYTTTKTYARVFFNKDKNGVNTPNKIVFNTYFLGDNGEYGNEYLETVYNPEEINKEIENHTPPALNKFTRAIKDKISGILQVDTLQMHLNKPVVIGGKKVSSLFGFTSCHKYTVSDKGIMSLNFVNAINNGSISVEFTLKKSNVSASFIMKNTPESWGTLYNINEHVKIIPGKEDVDDFDVSYFTASGERTF